MEKVDVYSMASVVWDWNHHQSLPAPHLHISVLEAAEGESR